MRSNSGLNFSNVSAGLAGASQAIGQGYDWKMRQQLDAMKDARAENLQRFILNKQLEHEDWRVKYQAGVEEEINERNQAIESAREAAAQARQQAAFDEYQRRMGAAQAAAEARAASDNDARSKALTKQLIAQNSIQMQNVARDRDALVGRLTQELDQAVERDPALSMISDASEKQRAMAADPAIGPILDAIAGAQDTYRRSTTELILRAASLGDPNYVGVTLAPLPSASISTSSGPTRTDLSGIGNPLGTPAPLGAATDSTKSSNSNVSGASTSTPDNPRAGADAPIYPSDAASDNSPAITQPSYGAAPPGSQPGSSAAGMPPTAGLMRPPVTSMIGPVVAPLQLIPAAARNASNVAPMPGINIPAVGAQPQLIPQQYAA